MRLLTPRRGIGLALLLLAMGALDFPFHFYVWISPDGKLLPSTVPEVVFLRLAILASALLTIIITTLWKAPLLEDFRNRTRDDFDQWHSNLRAGPPMETRPLQRLLPLACAAVLAALILTIHWSVLINGKGTPLYDDVVREDGAWENLTSICLLSAGVVLIAACCVRQSATSGLVAPVLLALMMFFGAGEEINWGQRVFGFETPEALKTVNVQHEFNVHNTGSYWANQLMMIFFLSFVALLPLLAKCFEDIRYLVERLNVPLTPLRLAPFGVIGVLLDERLPFQAFLGDPSWRLSEAREALFSVVMACVAVHTLIAWNMQRLAQARIAEPARVIYSPSSGVVIRSVASRRRRDGTTA